jgi:hypothetical protein
MTDMRDSHLVHSTCISCHDQDDVHDNSYLTNHTESIACQTCHIPDYGRASPQMVNWDWSQAGRTNDDGSPVIERNDDGLLIYHGHYGAFEWAEDIEPEYIWFDGTITFTKVGDEIDPSQTVQVNQYQGEYGDGESMLWPLRVYQGVQPYDAENNHLVSVNLYGEEEDAFFQGLDWNDAITSAMQSESGAVYSGEYDFVETEMSWPLNHMVAPAGQSLQCADCHQRDGILADLDDGAYVIGRDHSTILDTLGGVMIAVALLGAVGHGTLRFVSYQRRTADEDTHEKESNHNG